MINNRALSAPRPVRSLGRRSVILSSAIVAALFAQLVLAASAGAYPRRLDPDTGAYFGSVVGARSGENQQSALQRVETRIGRNFGIDHQYYMWDQPVPMRQQTWDAQTGRIPFINWNAGKKAGGYVTWQAIANGSQDAWIRERARAFRAFASPIYLTFHHEPEDDLSRFGTPTQYAAAFRRIVTVFRSENVTNVAFVWTMMSWTFNPRSGRPLLDYYPGNAYVDMIGVDSYNWYPGRPGDEWRTFQDITQPAYDFSVAHSRPLMVVEYGVMEDPNVPGRKAQWFRDVLATAKRWPNLIALLYFDKTKRYSWDTDSSGSAATAYREIAADPYLNP